jgi:hypothetical protein
VGENPVERNPFARFGLGLVTVERKRGFAPGINTEIRAVEILSRVRPSAASRKDLLGVTLVVAMVTSLAQRHRHQAM